MPALPQESSIASQPDDLIEHFLAVRELTEQICSPLEIEDYVVQSADFVSPPKWHLAHTTWFFVNFGLHSYGVNFEWPDEHYPLLFNSYYKSQSSHWLQSSRGDVSRPTVREIRQFRQDVNDRVVEWLDSFSGAIPAEIASIVRLGLEHEQQHQELLLMDIKYILWSNPSRPAYVESPILFSEVPADVSHCTEWWSNDGGVFDFGTSMEVLEFCFDNETPQHKSHLRPFSIATELATNREFLEFIEDGGYQNPLLWLSEGWELVNQQKISAPLYWLNNDGVWSEYGLHGVQPLSPHCAVKHISFHEAYAFARWQDKRLPTEYEWELYAANVANHGAGQFLELTLDSAMTQTNDHVLSQQLHGGLWEWTSSPYSPYPGYRATMDAFGEYNGKFMINQMVLRGGCLATPANHYRPTYRNFYQAAQRWCFSGIRLAEDA